MLAPVKIRTRYFTRYDLAEIVARRPASDRMWWPSRKNRVTAQEGHHPRSVVERRRHSPERGSWVRSAKAGSLCLCGSDAPGTFTFVYSIFPRQSWLTTSLCRFGPMASTANASALTCPIECPRRVVIEGRVTIRTAIDVEVPVSVSVSRKPFRLHGEIPTAPATTATAIDNDDLEGTDSTAFGACIEDNTRG